MRILGNLWSRTGEEPRKGNELGLSTGQGWKPGLCPEDLRLPLYLFVKQ